MPSKNTVKIYTPNTAFHVYNRGVEKRRIFEDAQDYERFIRYLDIYLSPPQIIHQNEPLLRSNLVKNNLHGAVSLIAFCLMPNHFHLLLHQKEKDGITRLLKQISTAYSMYFNKRYDRTGALFQGTFKGAPVSDDKQILYLTRYIHKHPLERGASLKDFRWSSYLAYLGYSAEQSSKGQNRQNFISPKTALRALTTDVSYENFVEKEKEDLGPIAGLLIE